MEQQSQKLWTGNFIVLTICNLLLFLNLQMTLPTFPSYVKETFHANNLTVSLVTSLFAIAAIISRVYAGGALQKGKRNQILLIGLCIAALSTAGYYWCGAVSSLLLLRIGFGIGFGMTSTTFPTMVSNIIPAKRIGEGMGFFGLSTSLAMSIGPMIGLALLGSYGFHTLVIAATLITFIIFPLAHTVRNLPSPREEHASVQVAGKRRKIIDKKILLPFFLNFMLSVTYGGLLSFLALFGKEVHISNVGNFFLINALAVLLIRPFSGRIFDRKGHIAVLIPGAVLVILGLISLSYSTSMGRLMLSAVFYGLGFGILQPSIQAWMIKEVSPGERGMANGMFINSIDLGVAVGSMLLGVIASAIGYMVMYRISALFMIIFLIVYIFAVRAQFRHTKKLDPYKKMSA
ncbi:MFS transporter [Aneurinibacillus sp. Ricciae_BoGa-3]|uniref:MFS transporter n=1 Tax=Aneurinibacillus sp. Ricciae_BoGa-3 TaxID=3022697 RepID=UPI00233FD839|nr:MFS transporter [Aneurinibacillus sp. Ricciae_BoGa-3]WCK53404.1 MFS transporter [Aneurinibacillus sp. Ricciae_BoGa-3]